eukprot:GHVP01047299.1.p1 GENE.GHVP01047299.1~~GHVP01047299.1.p1  ORF type:complete len:116 (-),score=24.28 GHVP01047299.1:310-657(-)
MELQKFEKVPQQIEEDSSEIEKFLNDLPKKMRSQSGVYHCYSMGKVKDFQNPPFYRLQNYVAYQETELEDEGNVLTYIVKGPIVYCTNDGSVRKYSENILSPKGDYLFAINNPID